MAATSIPDARSVIDSAHKLRYFPTGAAAGDIVAMLTVRWRDGMSDKEASAMVRAAIREHMGPAPKSQVEKPLHPHPTYSPPPAPPVRAAS